MTQQESVDTAIAWSALTAIAFIIGFISSILITGTYSKGQQDCINGITNYQRVIAVDGSTNWIKLKH